MKDNTEQARLFQLHYIDNVVLTKTGQPFVDFCYYKCFIALLIFVTKRFSFLKISRMSLSTSGDLIEKCQHDSHLNLEAQKQ